MIGEKDDIIGANYAPLSEDEMQLVFSKIGITIAEEESKICL